MFVIIKLEWPPIFLQNVATTSRNDIVQAKEPEAYNEDQVNYPMEEDDNNIIVKDDGTNQLIKDLFTKMDDQDGDNDGIYDEPMIENPSKHFIKAQDKIFSLLHCCCRM